MSIVLRALEEPARQIAVNAGVEGSIVVEKLKSKQAVGYGYDAAKDEYTDMIERGVTDPTKVTRSALQNAASIAAMVLTTESLVTDIPAPEPAANPRRRRRHGRHVLAGSAGGQCLRRRVDEHPPHEQGVGVLRFGPVGAGGRG